MFKSKTCRIWSLVAIVVLVASVFCITATAEEVQLYDSLAYENKSANAKYDAANPDLGGWLVEYPTVSKGSAWITAVENHVGIGENLTKHNGILNGINVIYNVPTDKQVYIKDYPTIEFTRRLSNGTNAVNTYSSMYGVTLVMDDGQTVTKDYHWYSPVPVLNTGLCVQSDVEIQKDIMALEGNPKLVQVKFEVYSADKDYYYVLPSAYYKADDPATEDVNEAQAGSDFYFLSSYFKLLEAADVPTGLAGVTDNWDGTEADAHDGKITGLDPEKSYAYAPVHSLDSAFTTVTGVSEITGLVGGVYEVCGVEEGKQNSDSVIVIVDKVTQGSKDNVSNFTEADLRMRSLEAVSGYWTSGTQAPSLNEKNSSGTNSYLAAHYYPYSASGVAYTAGYAAPTAKGAEYYRHNVVSYTYAFTPEEQFDIDKVAINSRQFNTNYPWKTSCPVTNKEATYAIYLYFNGDTENPYIHEEPWSSTSSVHSCYVNASNERDGYVTSMKFVVMYNIPDEPVDSNTTAYPLYAGLKTYALNLSTFAPEAAAQSDGVYKIIGLSASETYEYSADGGNTWETVTGVTELKDLAIGTYLIRELAATKDDAASELFEIEIAGGKAFVGEPVATGVMVSGLDADTVYEYSPVSVLGFDGWKDVEAGTTTLELTNGLYAIRVKGEGAYLPSAEEYVYIFDSKVVRDDIYTLDASGNKIVETTGTHGNSKQPFDIGYWSSTNYNVPEWTSTNTSYAFVRMGNFDLATDNATAFNQLLSVNVTYAMKPHQIVPVEDVVSFNTAHASTGYIGSAFLEGMVTADYTGCLRLYVAGSDVAYYDVEYGWYKTVNVQDLLPEDAHGYVTAIQFFPFAFIPEGANVQDAYKDSDATAEWTGRYCPMFMYLYSYKVAVAETIENTFSYEGYRDAYKITGFDSSKVYAISTDGVKWTELPEVSKSVTVEETGTYYIKVVGQNGNRDSEVVTFEVGAVQAPVTGLVYADGKITGLNADLAYEYGVLNINDIEWTEITDVTEIEVAEGVWAVRLAATEDLGAGAPAYVVAEGEKYGNIAWGKYSRETAGFLQGYWTSACQKIYTDAFKDSAILGAGTTNLALRLATSIRVEYDNRMDHVFRYALEDGEVFPLSNFGVFDISIGMGYGTNYWTQATHLDLLVRVHVAGGTQEYYDIITRYRNTSWTQFSVDPTTVIPDGAEGYVTALEFYPTYDVIGGTENVGATRYPVMRLFYYDTDPETAFTVKEDALAATEKWRCDLWAQAAPELEVVLSDDANYVSGYKITGLDANKTYEYLVNNETTTNVVEAGTTEIICTTPGVYKVRVAATETSGASLYTTVTVPFINPVFGKRSQYGYINNQILGNGDFVSGKWTTTNATWVAGATEVVSQITKDKVLNTVSYGFEFPEEDRFEVSEHPWFSIDMRSQYINMGFSCIPGSVYKVDIYTDDSDVPYTLTKEWVVGFNIINDKTLNAFTVNLLDEFPALEGKTIRAFKITPYSNIDKTPNDYNVTAEKDRICTIICCT